MSRRSSLGFAAAIVVAASAASPGAVDARDYKIGCANRACVIVDDTGRVTFFSLADKKLAEGADQLKGPATGRIRPPLNISCGGDACVVTDADGDVWVGPTHAGTPFGDPVARIPLPGAR
jgi:hypothetical protein